MEKEKIIIKLAQMGREIKQQNNRSTSESLFVDVNRSNLNQSHCFSFFEIDVSHSEENYIISNNEANKMNTLKELIIELGKY